MADLSVTATSVARGSEAIVNRDYNAGETITAGQCVYLKTSTNEWMKAQNDGTAEEAGGSTLFGIALHASADGQPLAVQTSGEITIGATVTVGTIYIVSASAGGIAPTTDLASSSYVTIVGYGKTAAILKLTPVVTGVEVP